MQARAPAAYAGGGGGGGGGSDGGAAEPEAAEDLTPKLFQLGSIKVTSEVDIIFELVPVPK